MVSVYLLCVNTYTPLEDVPVHSGATPHLSTHADVLLAEMEAGITYPLVAEIVLCFVWHCDNWFFLPTENNTDPSQNSSFFLMSIPFNRTQKNHNKVACICAF